MEPMANTSYGVQTPGGLVTWAFAVEGDYLWLVWRGAGPEWTRMVSWRLPQEVTQVEGWLKETVVPDLDERLAMLFPAVAPAAPAQTVESVVAATVRRACQYIATGYLGRPMFVYCPPEDPKNV